jgi:hypothetical protein
LVQLERQITMGLDLASEVGVHGGLRGRAHSDRLLQVGLSTFCDPGDLSREALNVLLLSLKVVRADEDGEVGVPNFESLDLVVEPGFDRLPNGVRGGLKDVANLPSVSVIAFEDDGAHAYQPATCD